ncbi:CPBP family intramembrane glutamic endopeptidase [Nocardia asteroides]|uniref:CPBP family intramembrane glutamic endopeptidase n=1 Tax=Nocardia asteroides TaxID=1824 RepID=UPI0037C8FF00
MSSADIEITESSRVASRTPTAAWVWIALGVYVLSTLSASAILLAVQPYARVDTAVLSLVQFGPVVGALVTWLMFRRTVAGVLPTAVSVGQVVVNVGAVVAVCVMYWLLTTAMAIVSGTATVGPAAVGGVPFVVFLMLQLAGASGEEIGWRGLMQPMLESRMAKLAAVSITGLSWALWHIQAFTAGPVTAGCFFAATMAFAVVLGYLGTGSVRQRVLVAAIGHWLINAASYLLAGDSTLDRPQIVFVAGAAVMVAAGAMLARRLPRF